MLNYKRVGKNGGKAVVLLHGFLGGTGYWVPLQSALKDFFDVIALDLPGFAASAHIASPDSIQGVSNVVTDFLDRLRVDRFAVLGFSMGGMIAQQIALDYSRRVEKLILYGTAAAGNLPNRFEPWEASIARVRSQGVEVTADKTVATWFLEGDRHPFYPVCRGACRGASEAACIKMMRAMQQWSVLDRLREINVPTLIVVGDKDRSTTPDESMQIWRQIPKAQLCILPNCAHGTHMERPDLFNRVILDFLLDNSSADS